METKIVSQETSGQHDHVAHIVTQWQEQRPDLDSTPMLVVGRITRLADRLDALLRPPFAAVGLTSGDFDVLAALRRSGEPYVLRHRDLVAKALVTPGAISKRIDRLVGQGLVTRRPHASDARGQDLGLTPRGVRFTDELIGQHLHNEAEILHVLPRAERDELATLLAKLLLALDPGS